MNAAAATHAGPPSASERAGRRTLFAVPFHSAMSDADAHRLAAALGMTMSLHPKLHGGPAAPGVARLDFDSGLFLIRGARQGEWALECRTWGDPPADVVHGWHVLAACAARLLDQTVPDP